MTSVQDEADDNDRDRLRARAEAGSPVAQAILGVVLLDGIDGERDYAGAFKWLSVAAARHVPRAMCHLGSMFDRGLGVAVDARRARELYEASAKRGEFLACVYLARLLASGRCDGVDELGALRWYREAASQRDRVQDCPELEEALSYVALHRAPAER